MPFAALKLDRRITQAIQYPKPTPIQAQSIPPILKGHDVVAVAQTGTGKTAAFVLPALQRLSSHSAPSKYSARPRILILTPTRELAGQITTAVSRYGKYLRLHAVTLVGGMPYPKQIRALARPLDLVVATPGRLLDHLAQRRLNLNAIEMLVLDEADRMLDMGFIDAVRTIAKETPADKQTLLFSATVDDRLSRIIKHLLKNPTHIDLSQKGIAPVDIQQTLYLVDHSSHKQRLLKHFLMNAGIFKAIIFTATKLTADSLAKTLRDQHFSAAALHGDLKQSVRNRTLEQLRKGKIQFLIATDVAARGIDIQAITHVINYDLPKFAEDYVHRIGRTGRAGKSGVAISLALPSDRPHLKRIERYIGHTLPRATIQGLEPTPSAKMPTLRKKKTSNRRHHATHVPLQKPKRPKAFREFSRSAKKKRASSR
jgi:superfamily II DNA/RNA helicase